MSDRRYPLCWPEGWKRTPPEKRRRAPYKVSEEQAKNELLHAVRLLGGSSVVLSTNIKLRQTDRLPFSNHPRLTDPGVAVYFTRGKKEQVIACDSWDRIGDNYRAVWVAVEALRSLERCGASELLDRAFTGFSALPAATSAPSWRAELGLGDGPVTREQVEAAYRKLALERHPDHGGSHDGFVRLNEARSAALREVSK